MVEIAFLIIAIALAAFLIALIPTLLRTRRVVKEVEETVAVLRTDINVTHEILAKANVLVEDVNEKIQTIDPLFVAVADLSESVSDLNTRARHLAAKASAAGASVGKAGSAFAIGKVASKLFGKKDKKK